MISPSIIDLNTEDTDQLYRKINNSDTSAEFAYRFTLF